MNIVLRIATGLCLAGAAVLVCHSGVQAQNLLDIQNGPPADAALYSAPAQNIEQVPVLPGLPQLTVTRPGGVAHVFPTVQNAAARAPRPVSTRARCSTTAAARCCSPLPGFF